ncbi:S-methyl-5'-thioadenosine phosphorylase [Thermosyntropha sp.]|uniref:S-methyl-5'-thioadenosine phosphorylase n=1 Tax=Thermosyntropha sp. TaxID=2740820 RepID=UPI0025F841BF|nr:S-methyl-5'-thioadenosine phosphorylase [Thermosyntropha sp.]MBO8159434.1 S-methyl-5'-thioadenosine phosphorylase [Thermosyntropha sp.]
MPEVAIIGGTGVYDPALLEDSREQVESTPYGEVRLIIGKYEEMEVAFIARHGEKHSVPPHLVNYRANIMALKQIGIKNIIATAAVGSLNYDLKPGHYVLADQFLDFTKSRKNTFYEGGEEGVVHCDMTVPYCPEIRDAIEKAGKELGLTIHNGGVYVCTEGPRFETAAEIAMFKMLGGSVIGMTSVPEVCLARELGMCYGNISIITNFAAGISPNILTHSEVVDMIKESINEVRKLIMSSLKYIPKEKKCDCAKILNEKGVMK